MKQKKPLSSNPNVPQRTLLLGEMHYSWDVVRANLSLNFLQLISKELAQNNALGCQDTATSAQLRIQAGCRQIKCTAL